MIGIGQTPGVKLLQVLGEIVYPLSIKELFNQQDVLAKVKILTDLSNHV